MPKPSTSTAERASCAVYRQADAGATVPPLVGVRHHVGASGATRLIAVPPTASIPVGATCARLPTGGPAIGPVELARSASGAPLFLVPLDPRGEALAGRVALSGLATKRADVDFTMVARMVRAAAECERGLLAGWGFEPDGPLAIARPPVAARQGWPGIDDAPSV